jgi:RNA polymerase sigma-70 factor (ECF subfamily)
MEEQNVVVEGTTASHLHAKHEHLKGMTDEQLLSAFLAGNHAAYGALVRRYKDPITNFAYRFLGNYEDAVDIAQETFVRVFRFGSTFVGEVKFSTWLFTIASNLSKSELKRYRRRYGVSMKDAFGGPGRNDDDASWDVPDTTYMPDERIDRDKIVQEVQRALMHVTPTYREMVILRDVQQLSYEEIAEITQSELGTVKSRINRGRAQLKEQLRDLYHELFALEDE